MKLFRIFLVAIFTAALISCTHLSSKENSPRTPASANSKMIVAYEFGSTPKKIEDTPDYINVIILAFRQPDFSYSGNNSSRFQESIRNLHRMHPTTKVMIAIGGWGSESKWNKFDPGSIAKFVEANGLDGVDLDFEPENPKCSISQSQDSVICDTDEKFISIIGEMRQALPRPYLISAAVWGNGAFGIGRFKDSFPKNPYSGIAINVLNKAGSALDFINVMSYELPIGFNPEESVVAYSEIFHNPINLGIQLRREGKGHVLSMGEVQRFAKFTAQRDQFGMMVWTVNGKRAKGLPSPDEALSEICRIYGSPRCEAWYPKPICKEGHYSKSVIRGSNRLILHPLDGTSEVVILNSELADSFPQGVDDMFQISDSKVIQLGGKSLLVGHIVPQPSCE